MQQDQLTPGRVMQMGLGFWASKCLMSAVELGVFDQLDRDGPQTCEELQEAVGLHPRSSRDFLDALVALGLLDREGGRYRNAPEADAFLVSGRPGSVMGFLEMANDRLYPFWGRLEEALRTGEPTNELRDGDRLQHPFEAIYGSAQRLGQFVGAMTGLSRGVAEALAHELDWGDHESVVDLGTSEGVVPLRIAEENDHLRAIGVDLPRVEPYFKAFTAGSPAADRLEFRSGDFFADEPLPPADAYVLGHILHDWGLDDRRAILSKVAEAVEPGGMVVVYGTMIDDERREATMPLLMSLNMLVETLEGSDYTARECIGWLREVGFEGGRRMPLPGPETAVVARR